MIDTCVQLKVWNIWLTNEPRLIKENESRVKVENISLLENCTCGPPELITGMRQWDAILATGSNARPLRKLILHACSSG